MASAVLLITGFVMIEAEGPFLAERDDRDSPLADTGFNQVTTDGFGPFVSQHQVIRARAALITMTLDP
jgi:hypothetical protein